MRKPRITAAAVIAAYDVLVDSPVPENYFKVSSDEQRQMRLAIVQQALIAAAVAEQLRK